MQTFIINFMNKFGYIGIALLIAFENIFPPIPSEVILTFGGFLTTKTKMIAIGVIISSTIGSVLGAVILYLIGRILNADKIASIVDGKIGKYLHLKKQDIEKANNWFSKKGKYTVFFCRFVPIVRSLISIPAGMNKMNFGLFLTLTTIGTSIWNTVLVLLGQKAGENWTKIVDIVGTYSKIGLIVLIIIFIILVFLFYKFIIKKYKQKNL